MYYWYVNKQLRTRLMAGLKKRVTIRESEKKRTKWSEIESSFLQMFNYFIPCYRKYNAHTISEIYKCT